MECIKEKILCVRLCPMAEVTPWAAVFEHVIKRAIDEFGGYEPDGVHPDTPEEFRRKLALAQQSSGLYSARPVNSKKGIQYFNVNNAELRAHHDNLLTEKMKTHYWYSRENERSEWRDKMLDVVHTRRQVEAAERQHQEQEGN